MKTKGWMNLYFGLDTVSIPHLEHIKLDKYLRTCPRNTEHEFMNSVQEVLQSLSRRMALTLHKQTDRTYVLCCSTSSY